MGTLLGMWIATALLYPALRNAINRFVDKVILRRADYAQFRVEVARAAATHETAEAVLDEVCDRLKAVLTTNEVFWLRQHSDQADNADQIQGSGVGGRGAGIENESTLQITHHASRITQMADFQTAMESSERFPPGIAFLLDLHAVSAAIIVPTTEAPRFVIVIGELSGGRRLLSDDIALIEAVALLVARRIDALRIMHERCEQGIREQQIGKLATEAELRALRAQINPHFLFNALTTIGYLIQTAPDRALNTLLRLTGLLRIVLRSAGEFVTLGKELELIESYLDIERARFEDRLKVTIDVPDRLRALPVPPLIIQPLVENAIKHGIAPCKAGGEVRVSALLESALGDGSSATDLLCVSVRDTGAGVGCIELAHRRKTGLGLNNVEQRLKASFGARASLIINSARGAGTTVEAWLPVNLSEITVHKDAGQRRRA